MGPLAEEGVRQIARQLFLALNYLHSHNVVHRDICADNVMIDGSAKLSVKVIDFGSA